jgi:glucose-1-phosphate thymidylyltransferase
MAGFGTRLRPHTWSKPKPLVQIAGKTVLAHVLDIVSTAADLNDCRLVFIIGYLGDKIQDYMKTNYPNVETNYYVQEKMLGQTHAIAMAREQLEGPTLVLFSDTIVQDDMSFLLDDEEQEEAVIWVKKVEDPRRFGVVVTGEDGYVQQIIEKPDSMENDLAVVGYYYFKKGEDLLKAIDSQMDQNMMTKGEYYLADAIMLMVKQGLKLTPKPVDIWLDAGIPDTVLATNRFLLAHGNEKMEQNVRPDDVKITPPVYIHPSAKLKNVKIGPNVSIGPNVTVANSQIQDAIIEMGADVQSCHLKHSLVGERAHISGLNGALVIGDDASVWADNTN